MTNRHGAISLGMYVTDMVFAARLARSTWWQISRKVAGIVQPGFAIA
ncbi:hypothetical protein [Marivita sp. S0852]